MNTEASMNFPFLCPSITLLYSVFVSVYVMSGLDKVYRSN